MRSAAFSGMALLTLVALAACSKAAPESVAPLYDSAPVETRSIEVTVDAAGIVEPESLVEVKSKASGEVLAVHAEVGDVVEAGKLLVEIDKRTPRNAVSQTEAALAAAKARRTIAKTQLDRANQLYKSQTLTQIDVEKAELEYANAASQVVSSEVALENARITLEDTSVRAPNAGTILEKTVEPGIVITSPTQAVSGGTVLMKMADLTSVQVRTRVDETDIGKIQPGMATRVTVAAYPNQPFDGVVLKVEPQAIVEQNVTMFSVLIKLQNRGGVLKPGMNADVQIKIANRDSVATVPTAALRADTDVTLSAKMLNMDEAVLREQIWPTKKVDGASAAAAPGAGGKNVLNLGGREITLPDGVDAKQVMALMEKRRGGQELSQEERDLMRKVFQQAGGFAGGGGAGGGPGGGGGRCGRRRSGPRWCSRRRRCWRRRARRRQLPAGRLCGRRVPGRRLRHRPRRPRRSRAGSRRHDQLPVRRRILGHSAAQRPAGSGRGAHRSYGPRIQRDRLGPRARRSRVALAEHESVRAARAAAAVHLATFRREHTVPAEPAAEHPAAVPLIVRLAHPPAGIIAP